MRRRQAGVSGLKAFLVAIRTGARAISRSVWSSVAIAVAAVGLLWIPIHWAVGPLGSADDAKEFLQTLWQVEAAILALSLAVLVLAFEGFGAARSSQTDSFLEFAAETQLLLVFYLGLAALVAIGLVLLQLPPGAPGGWPATWAVITTTAATLALAFLVQRTLSVLSPAALLRRRMRLVQGLVTESISVQLRELEAVSLLHTWCKQRSIDLALIMRSTVSPSETPILASRSGTVVDLRLRRLERAFKKIKADSGAKPKRLLIRLGDQCRQGDPLIVFDGAVARRYRRRVIRAVRLEP